MDINATLIGQMVLISAIVIGAISYYLGKRKTQTPVITGLIGFALGLVPLFGIIYLVVLSFKQDIEPA